MRASELPGDLARGRRRLQAWRERRRAGEGIRPSLWAMAVRLVNRHGVSRTATALGLDYYSLKKRVEAAAQQPPSAGPAFIELPAPVLAGKQCLFELDNSVGVRMRLQLLGYEAHEIETVARALWTAE